MERCFSYINCQSKQLKVYCLLIIKISFIYPFITKWYFWNTKAFKFYIIGSLGGTMIKPLEVVTYNSRQSGKHSESQQIHSGHLLKMYPSKS